MRYVSQNKLTFAFFLLCIIDIAGIATGFAPMHFIAKPLLVPVLMILLFLTSTAVPGKSLLLTGLFFSWLGDCFLLFEYQNKHFFIVGLAAFLITHLFYISFFLRVRSEAPSILKKQPLWGVLVAGYGISLVLILYPRLGDLAIPVMAYAVVICLMLICSLHVLLKLNSPAGKLYVAGAAFFVLSDSLLAINRFYHPLPFAGIWIMLTYCAAQYCIVKAYTEQYSSKIPV